MPNYNHPTAGFNKNPGNINKKGRPKREWTWAGLLEQAAEETKDAKTRKQIVTEKLYELAEKGDMTAIKEVMNRTDGMPKQSTDVTTGGEKLNAIEMSDEKYAALITRAYKEIGVKS